MLFNSFEFILFFPIVTILFYLLPHKFRWLHLLIASCVFYMFFIPQYILILLVTILIDYVAGIYIEKSHEQRKKKMLLIVSIISTCLVLFVFKYFDFFNQNMILLSQKIGFHYNIKMIRLLLPIGLSFHTFQSLSYVIEVYRGKQKAEKHFGIYSLYVMFYPQLVTGPIERPQNLLVQLREKKTFQYANLVEGLRLILFGLFTKMVVADNLAVYVDQVYGSPATHNTVSILIGLVFYSFQIYCDFFGYSTIAVGCARAMGYNLMDNFKNPYLSKSIGEFWQRWHISLSTWFRDYVYISLGGNRVNVKRWMFNILVVFGLSGLWHGANWTFVLWGLAHGLVYILENLVTRLLKLKHPETRWMITVTDAFNVVKTFVIVSFIWILFRATDVSHVKSILVSLVNNLNVADNFSVDMKTWLFFALFIVLDVLLFKSRFDRWCNQRSTLVRWSMYAAMIFMIIVFSSVSNFPFIYFQF